MFTYFVLIIIILIYRLKQCPENLIYSLKLGQTSWLQDTFGEQMLRNYIDKTAVI